MFKISKESFVSFITLITAGLFIGLPLYFYVPYWYSAFQASRITDPEAYYQEKVGKLLLEHGTAYRLEPKADTSDWKTYKNKEYGFSFKYPKDAVVTEKMVQEYQWPELHLVVSVQYPANDVSETKSIAFLEVYKYPKGWNIYFNTYNYLNELNLYNEKKDVEAYLNLEPWQKEHMKKWSGISLMYTKNSTGKIIFSSPGSYCFSTVSYFLDSSGCVEQNSCGDPKDRDNPNDFGIVGKKNSTCFSFGSSVGDNIKNSMVDSFRFQ